MIRPATLLTAAALMATCAFPAMADEAISTAGAPMPSSENLTSTPVRSLPESNIDTSAQIQQWLAASAERPDAPALDLRRKTHGEFGVSVGTGGYRSAYVVSTTPLGETGSLTLAFSQSKGGRGGYGYYDDYGYGQPGLGRGFR